MYGDLSGTGLPEQDKGIRGDPRQQVRGLRSGIGPDRWMVSRGTVSHGSERDADTGPRT